MHRPQIFSTGDLIFNGFTWIVERQIPPKYFQTVGSSCQYDRVKCYSRSRCTSKYIRLA